MGNPILATDEEIEEIILGPDSLVWQRFGDIRLFAASGYALMLQVAHPTVGAGVRDHSTFEQDPWGRLLRTTDYLFLLVYGDRGAAAMGRRLRELHKTIKGSNPDGSRYSALEPGAYAWVHATLIEGAIKAYERFVGPLRADEVERFYAEYLPLGRLVGVRTDDLPSDWAGFREYFDSMVSERLERNETVERVLRAMAHPAPPPRFPASVDMLWRLLRIAPSQALRITTIGLMSPQLRELLGVQWSRVQEAELRGLSATARAVGPIMPRQLHEVGSWYLRWRAEEIAQGPLGSGGNGALTAEGTPVPHAT